MVYHCWKFLLGPEECPKVVRFCCCFFGLPPRISVKATSKSAGL
jgi:hypothetical protein